MTHTSSQLTGGGIPTKRRFFTTWARDKFGSSTPKTVFSFTARTAMILSVGQGIPIQITLNYDFVASNLSSISEFRLLEVKYKIKAISHTISCGGFSPDLGAYVSTTVFKRQFRFAQMALIDGQTLDIGLIDPEQGGLHSLSLDTALVTSFETYNIARKYQVEIGIIFQCGGKQMTAESRWDHVNVVFNETYHHLRAPTQFAGANNDLTFSGAARVAGVIGVTTLALLGAG